MATNKEEKTTTSVESTSPNVPDVPDTRDAKIAELEATVKNLEKKLKSVKAAPLGNTVTLDGTTYPVIRTVMAKFALDEVKKGHIEEDCTLVVINRRE